MQLLFRSLLKMPRVSTLLMIVLMLFAIPVKAEPKIYVGTVGTGPGVAVLGHGFILIGDTKIPQSYWMTYDFIVQSESKGPIELENFVESPENFKIKAQKMPFYMHKNNYQLIENRHLTLVSLNLNETQILKLVQLLENEVNSNGVLLQYKIHRNNCITRMIDLLNQVLAPNQQIQIYYDSTQFQNSFHPLSENKFWKHPLSSLNSIRQSISNSFLNIIPFNFVRYMQNHLLYAGETIHLKNRDQIFSEYYLIIKTKSNKITESCFQNLKIAEALNLQFILISQNPSKYNFKKLFENLSQKCPTQSADLSDIALLLSRMMLGENRIDLRRELQNIGNTLGMQSNKSMGTK